MRAKLSLLAVAVAVSSSVVRAEDQPSDATPKNGMVTKAISVKELILADAVEARAAEALKLRQLVVGMVRPYVWQDLGGPGSIGYDDDGRTLVVTNSPAAMKEVEELLAALRELNTPAFKARLAAETVAKYRKACAEDRKDEAVRLAVQALALDPTCFAGTGSSK